MDDGQLERILSNQWTRAVEASCAGLERGDRQQVSSLSSWDDLEAQVQGASHPESMMLSPALKQLRLFTDEWMIRSVPDIGLSDFLGLVRLLIKLVQDEEATVMYILRLFRGLCHKIEIFNGYCAEAWSLTSQLKESCMEIALTLISLCSFTIGLLRSEVELFTSKNRVGNEYQPLADAFSNASHTIDQAISRMENLSKIHVKGTRSGADLINDSKSDQAATIPTSSLSRLAVSQPEEHAKLPCVLLPSIKTPRFFDRTEIIQKIDSHFREHDVQESFHSLALHGLGGVGKSAVALRYAESKFQQGELDALFWVYSEKPVSIEQSFTDIAVRLKLPGARPADHEENRALALNWLQTTRCRWLIVYDNAEDRDLILSHWPAVSRGQALITTRNHSFAFDLAERGLEVLPWDIKTGSKYVLHLLSTGIGAELNDNDISSAEQLSERLSGHALAISSMAGLIHRREWTIAEFMNLYNEHGSKMHKMSGNESIDAIWDISFRSLDPDSFSILGAFCFLSPDSIPQSIFEVERKDDLTESLGFCFDRLRFFEAIEVLLALALIKRDKVSRTFSVHRLVQSSFSQFMTPDQKQQSFVDAATLISRAFPRKDAALAEMYTVWARCAVYLQHVLRLKDSFAKEKHSDHPLTAVPVYCALNNACQRYLLEINAYTELDHLTKVNMMALETLPIEQRTSSLQAPLLSHMGQLQYRLGNVVEGIDWSKKCYNIRSLEGNVHEQAWGADNIGKGYAILGNYEESIQWLERAREHSKVATDGDWTPTLQMIMGMVLVWADQPLQAEQLLQQALQRLKNMVPYQWAGVAYTYFGLGNLRRLGRNYEAAEECFMDAQNAWLKGDQLRSDPFNGCCMYKLGCTSLDQGKKEAAIKHLRDALVVTEMRSINLVGEHARVLWKLSKALGQVLGEETEASRLCDEAHHLLKQRLPDVHASDNEKTYDQAVHIYWR